MPVRPYHETDAERWDDYVDSSSGSSLYHRAGWKAVIEKTFGHRTHYLLSQDAGGRIDGVLPLVRLKSRVFGNFLISLPYFNYGGICADNPQAHRRLLEEAIAVAHRENAEHIELRDTRKLDDGLQVKNSKVSMRLELPSDPNELWSSFRSKLRSQIRRPSREGIEARIGGAEELHAFYRVFAINMRDLGTPVYPIRFFRNILEEFSDSVTLCTVHRKGKPVACALLAGFKDTMEIPWAGSLRRFNRFSPNMLLYWTALKCACERGYGVFDFGRSTPGGGTYRFKEQWGARPVPLRWYYWVRDGRPMPELNPRNPRYAMAIRAWKRLPVHVTRLLGPVIVKNLP